MKGGGGSYDDIQYLKLVVGRAHAGAQTLVTETIPKAAHAVHRHMAAEMAAPARTVVTRRWRGTLPHTFTGAHTLPHANAHRRLNEKNENGLLLALPFH